MDSLKERVGKLERQQRIQNYIKASYNNRTANLYCHDLLVKIKSRFQDNTAVWRLVIRDLGSAYAYAYQNFNRVIRLQNQEIQARRQMWQDVVAIFAGVALGWINTPIQECSLFVKIFNKRAARAFFSNGIKEVVKDSAINIPGMIDDVRYMQNFIVAANSKQLMPPLAFQDQLMNAFENNIDQVVRQFDETMTKLQEIRPATFLKDLKKYAFDINDPNLTDKEMFKKIDGPYEVAKKFAHDITTELVKSSFYYREKPNAKIYHQGGINPVFRNFMARRFERALWAGWISKSLVHNKDVRLENGMPFLIFATGRFKQLRNDCSRPANIQKLKPGFYADVCTGKDSLVERSYTDPTKSLINRLEYLKVFLSGNRTGDESRAVNKIRKFGSWSSDDDVKRLIAWANRELSSKIEGQTGFSYQTRPQNELYIAT